MLVREYPLGHPQKSFYYIKVLLLADSASKSQSIQFGIWFSMTDKFHIIVRLVIPTWE